MVLMILLYATEKIPCYQINNRGFYFLLWSHLGSNQGLPDYESGALTC
jgi:hypothetical protein